MRVAPLFWEWPRIEEGDLTTESQTWPWSLIYQRPLTPLTTIFCWQDWKHIVSLNSPWVWCHPFYWVVNRGFVCMVCAQVSQSWGRGFHRGRSSGHCCFNIFINDLNYAVPDVSLRLYADDTTLYASDVSPIALQFVVNRCLSRLSEWFDTNYLLINNAKTQALLIGPCEYDFDLTFNGSGVTKLPSLRILGVELDSMLNFTEHISSQLKNAYAKTGPLRRIRHIVPMDVMLALYKSFILPHLEYCSPLLLGVGKVQANKIEDTNYYNDTDRAREIIVLPRTLTYM